MNVLLTSVGRRDYLVEYFRQALQGRGKVVATNTIAETTGMFAADAAEVVPPARDPGFIDTLVEICHRHRIRLLCSLHDWEAPYIAPHKARFLAQDTVVAIPNPKITNVCLDKFETFRLAHSLGVPSPECYVDIKSTLTGLRTGKLSFPLILKPRWGQGSISITKIYRQEDLEPEYKRMVEELTTNNLGYLAGEESDRQVLFQQLATGQEFGVDIVNDLDGNYVACFVKRKLAMRFGETDAAETVSMPQIEQYSRKIAAATRHPGNMDADFFRTEDGRLVLLELNPRFGGGYPFSHMAGANVPAAMIAWATGEKPKPEWLRVKLGEKSFKAIRLVKPPQPEL